MTSQHPLELHLARVRADDWPRASARQVQGRLRSRPEDFVVDERALPADPDTARRGGMGEYVHLRIRKRNLTTAWVAGGLARHFGVPLRDVGHAGLKDRRAVTSQWFSVRAPSGAPLQPWFEPGTVILETLPAHVALRPGDLAGNGFCLRVREVDDPAALESALVALRATPLVPNYFGSQRFGNGAANLEAVWDWSAGRRSPGTRFERGIWLSTARSLLFNLALADRVQAGDWRQSLPGEARVHGAPSGPLWGRGRTLVQRDALARCLETWRGAGPARALVEREGLRQDLRPWALAVADLDWHWMGRDAVLRFALPAGGYATTVLRELLRGAALASEDEDDVPSGDAAGVASSRPQRISGAAR